MDKIDLKKIADYLKKNLSAERFSHSIFAAKTAKKIAKIIGGVNPEKAYLAGLVHDCTRGIGDDKLISLSKEYRIKIDHFTQKAPYLLHAAAGAKIAKKQFKITDNEILQAIEKHCVPKPYMNLLDKIIYLADAEKQWTEISKILMSEKKSPDQALLYAYDEHIKYFVQHGEKIHPDLIRSRNKLLENFAKKILILGSNGMLGKSLSEEFKDCQLTAWDKKDLDITDRKKLQEKILLLRPDIIINAAADTDVEKAEESQEKALRINGKAVGNLAQSAKKINAILVHYSTDYVFDGKSRKGYKETAQPNPINVYGKSKFLGEALLRRNCDRYYLIRSSWMFGKGGINFVDKILQKAANNAKLDVVNDQWGKPTYACDLARATKQILEQERPFGIYHLTNEGKTNWYQFGRKILAIAKSKAKVSPVSSQNYPTQAKRPMYSALLNTKLPKLRHWEEAVKEYLK